MNKALFLDRDGIINLDHGYVYKKEEFEFIEDIFAVCQFATQKGYQIYVITNQAGIGRGYYTVAQFEELTQWMKSVFLEKNIIISDVFYCPHHPKEGVGEYKMQCDCRKPEPGMLIAAQKKYDIDMSQSVFIGDKVSDIQAAAAACVTHKILLISHYGDEPNVQAHRINQLSEALQYIP